jgi:hypothetical protein
MGYSYQSIRVDLGRIKALCGSGDEETLAALLDHPDRYVRFLLEEPAPRAALSALICGDACDAEAPHHYGYAVEAMCFALGERLGSLDTRDEWRGIELLGEVGATLMQLMDITSERWFVPIRDTPDYPLVSTLTREECAAWRDALDAAIPEVKALGHTGWDQEMGLVALRHLRAISAQVAEQGLDLVTFLH